MNAQSAPPDPKMDGVEVVRHEDAVTLQIAEVVLFDSSRALLKTTAAPVLERAIMLLNEFGEVAVAVQGHTDNQPVRGGEFRSNWELSAARANAVAAFLLQQGFPPERLRVESYADTRPVAENDTRTGRAQNRRVALRVELPPVTGAITAR
jgi:chemotaxis protein MotB